MNKWLVSESKTISQVFLATATEIMDKGICQTTEFEISFEILCCA